LAAAELSASPEGCREIKISTEKRWANRAIGYGYTVLTDDELIDFINTATDCTWAYFRLREDEMSKDPGKLFYMCLGSGHQQCG